MYTVCILKINSCKTVNKEYPSNDIQNSLVGDTFWLPNEKAQCHPTYLVTYPLHPQWDIRPQQLRHKVLSFAEVWASPQDSPISFSSAITDCRHVIFGRPRFLFPGGVHLSATLGMLSWGIRRTCPSHLSRLRLISRTALLQPVFLQRSTLEILFG